MASAGVARAGECGIASAVLRMLETFGLFAKGNSLIRFETSARNGFERCECNERIGVTSDRSLVLFGECWWRVLV